MGIGDAVYTSILLAILYGFGDDFNAIDFFDMLGNWQANGPNSGVGVNHYILCSQVCKVNSCLIKLLCHFGIDLVKGWARDLEAIAQHLIGNIVLTIKRMPFFSKNRIGILVIDILHNGFDGWKLLDQLLDQLVHTEHLGTSGHQNDHDFSWMVTSADHQIANQTWLFLLIIRFEIKPTD